MKLCPICATPYPAGHRTCPTHGTVLVDAPDLPPGTMIRDCYRIERTLGKGGMGTVYLAEHVLLGEPRALKFLSGELASNPAFVQRFVQEAKAASKLRHANIAATLELGQSEDGSFYISMEYVDGPSLRTVLEQSPHGLAVERVLGIVRGVAGALGAAHARRLVHRDIKPENVLLASTLDRTGIRSMNPGLNANLVAYGELAKVVDFGIVAITDEASKLTQTGRPLLTAEYAAPEQWRGVVQGSDLDGRTDLYSLGCMFFEMLTGRLPFHADNYEGWFEQHVYATAPSPSYFRPELARYGGLDTAVLHLLAKERDQRTANVQELLAELDRVVQLPDAGRVTAVYGAQEDAAQRHSYGSASTVFPEALQTLEKLHNPYQPHPVSNQVPNQVSNQAANQVSASPPTPPADHGWSAVGARPAAIPQQSAAMSAPAYAPMPGAMPGAMPGPLGPVQPQRVQAGPANSSRYTLILLLALGALVAITLLTAGLVTMQRRQEAARAKTGNQDDQTATQSVNDNAGTPQAAAQTGTGSNGGVQASVPLIAKPNPGTISHTPARVEPSGKTDLKPATQTHADSAPVDPAKQALALFHDQQYAQAAPLFEQTCNGGQADSCDYLGRMYQHKQGVEQDYLRAATLYAKACEGNSLQGCNHLATMYKNKQGVELDYARAIVLYGKACNGGLLESCSDLGFMYQHKQGVELDYGRALTLYERACNGGVALACNNLGVMYQDKEGVEQDFARAAALYGKACDAGNANGCSDLGDLYRTGSGVEKDVEKARTYLSKGCSMGNQWGCAHLKQIE